MHLLRLVTLVLVVCLAAGCSNGVPTGTIRVLLTDAPGEVEALNVTIVEVAAHREGSGWETLSTEERTVDLVTLQDGVLTTLAVALVPAGHYTQIRLMLAPGSEAVIDGTTHELVVPSGIQSGIKLIRPFEVPDDGEIELTLDFDARTSVIETGDGRWMLKPTIAITSD
jgi:hypothetical protein